MNLADSPARRPVLASTWQYRSGRVIDVRTDTVRLSSGAEVIRDVVSHPGAVGVVCLNEAGAILLVRQYRHCVGHELWEPPAGLLDHPGEEPQAAAARELREEAGLQASSWHVLVDAFTSPGMTDESVRVYLARGISAGGARSGTDEELDMPSEWVDLDEAVAKVLAGELHNPMAAIGILATFAARADGFASLRPVDAPWPARPGQ